MKKKNKIWTYHLIVFGFIVILIIGCKKEEPKKDPVITWENPDDISFGTLLSATQLNATADVTGTFVYTPIIGTQLDVGPKQDLKVDFNPTDITTYNVAGKTVKINVIQSTGDGGISSAVFNTTKTYGNVTDQNGNVYKTISIGNQTWMAENLRVTKYRNGDPITNVTNIESWRALTTGAYCTYENNISIDEMATYGALYNWYAVSDSRNIAPTGWHVATEPEWNNLFDYLTGGAGCKSRLI